MTAKLAWLFFRERAFRLGYREKVAGDDAFTKHRTPHSPMIKLLGAKYGSIQVYESGKGRYEICMSQPQE